MAKTTIPVELSSTPGITDNSNATAITIDSSERVGIICSDPTAYLEIDPAAADTAIFSIRRQDHATVPLFKIVQDSSVSQGAGHCHITSSNRDMSITAGENLDKTKGLYIKTTGEVGIGTSSPARELDVQAASGWGEIALRGASGSGASLEFYTTSTKRAEIFTDTEDIVFRNTASNTERMRIHSTGAVTKPTNCYFLAVRTSNLQTYNFAATTGATTTIFTDLVAAQTSALGTSSFSTTDGTFTAPVDGLYLFHFSFYSNVTIEQAWLTSNGARISYTDVTSNTSSSGTVFNGSIQYYMTSGASIRIHPYSAGSTSDYIYDNAYHTYWKGVLLG